MTALSDALEAAQAKALSALEKAYVRGALEYDEFQAKMNEIGLTDDIDQALLVFSLDILKEYGQTEPAYTEKRKTQPASQAQLDFIGRLCAERNIEPPDLAGLTKPKAHELINQLQDGSYTPSDWSVPF